MTATEIVPSAEQRLDVRVVGSGGTAEHGTQSGTVHTEPSGSDGWIALIVTSSAVESDRVAAAEDAMLETLRTEEDPDLAAVLRKAFRSANQSVLDSSNEEASDGIAAIAMLTTGKSASIALAGDHRAYLYRANRMTQLTRDQRVYRATSRRKEDVERAKDISGNDRQALLLGVRDRLDSRTPAIFELSLLPEDKLALVSENVYSTLGDEEMERIVSGDSVLAANTLTSDTGALSPSEPALAAVLSVAPAREPRPDVRSYSGAGIPWLPALLALLALIAVIAVVALLVI